jgi:hypothetical protein
MKKIHPELSQLRFFYGIQSAVAIALPLLIGLLIGNLKLIILPALAAFLINLFLGSLSVSYRDKLLGVAIATLGCAGVMSLGTVIPFFKKYVILGKGIVCVVKRQ